MPYNQPIFPFGIPAKESLELLAGSFSEAYPAKEARCFDDLLTAIDEAEEKKSTAHDMSSPNG